MQSYYWNGNIRQLKNIAEQVSVIEMDHHISAETLRRYLPDNERQSGLALSAVSAGNGGKDYSHEIGILYNMILKLQQELSDLRAEIGGGHTSSLYTAPPALMQSSAAPVAPRNEVQEAEVVPSDQQPHSLEDTQREIIRRTLEQCNNNRKTTAEKLGISERTLYRKIKEYNL